MTQPLPLEIAVIFFVAMYYPQSSINKLLIQIDIEIKKAKSRIVNSGNENLKSLAHPLKPLLQNKAAFYQIKESTHETILGHIVLGRLVSSILK
ncbi:hypothetical protein [Adhaeribacter radiodurans]|uniref:Uncharacterized protein n=1 Tax=Adhaeribacter radiodurans TaxID=2745197 RepID=A0A7L7LAP3_9BACT|nr:hypothetical protein [Adhaeribacter radiodurans]QMU29807.1 hypothetical protein HUW48_18045 [Adhaeribacter radiodurans]